MSARGGELIATVESAVLAKLFLDAIVVEDSQSDGRLADPTSTDESDRGEVSCRANDLLDQLVASETDSRWRRR